MSNIGKNMYNRRKELGLTLEQVGDAVGVGKSTVRRWENGMIKHMGRDKISALARVLQMSPVEFVPLDDDPPAAGMVRVEVQQDTQGRRLYATDAMPRRADLSGVYGTARTTEAIKGTLIPGAKVAQVAQVDIDPELRVLLRMWKKSTPERRKKIVRIIKELYSEDD